MELTFLKLAGPHTTAERENGGEEAGKRNAEAKKIEAPERVGWTGIMAVLELHYQSSVPSAPRHHLALRALRSTLFHSIPPLFHPWTTLETLAVPYPSSRAGENPRQTRRFPSYVAAQALSPLSWRMTLHSLGCICMVSSLPDCHLPGFTSANICITFCVIYMNLHTKIILMSGESHFNIPSMI